MSTMMSEGSWVRLRGGGARPGGGGGVWGRKVAQGSEPFRREPDKRAQNISKQPRAAQLMPP